MQLRFPEQVCGSVEPVFAAPVAGVRLMTSELTGWKSLFRPLDSAVAEIVSLLTVPSNLPDMNAPAGKPPAGFGRGKSVGCDVAMISKRQGRKAAAAARRGDESVGIENDPLESAGLLGYQHPVTVNPL